MRVALLIGDDFHSQLLTSRFLRLGADRGWTTRIWSVERRSQSSADPLMRAWRALETRVFPVLLQAMGGPQADQAGQALLDAHYRGLGATGSGTVSDVNDRRFVAQLRALRPDLVISVRCYQKLAAPTIAALSDTGAGSRLLNLHPGRLPAFRGVLTYLHQLALQDLHGAHSLHVISPRWDDGPLLAVSSDPLDPRRCLASNYFRTASVGASMLAKELDRAERVSVPTFLSAAQRQPADCARYFSGADAVATLNAGPVRICDPVELEADVAEIWGTAVAGRFRALMTRDLPGAAWAHLLAC